MGLGENACCQIVKSSVEKRFRLVHNAEATKTDEKTHGATIYVNICNQTTPDIVEKRQGTTDIQYIGLHKIRNKTAYKVDEICEKQLNT